MGDYRVYCTDADNRIVSAYWVDAADEAGAVQAVEDQGHLFACEVWQGTRRIATVPAASTQRIARQDA
ncbi:hypothetical protein OMW55_04805 [Sphingomonas sp. BN140010]|uniref:Uncharacterized protein n=1 Tax=Sphingomonas arvum TaxID=2992113 RepID=A0ABT3JE82_9SPHN|nr:hypothetical protein [Sphingomonas sp. BN140010]MCW3797126.1 hypothetical protein [Sphingomonas sp. BN140010]